VYFPASSSMKFNTIPLRPLRRRISRTLQYVLRYHRSRRLDVPRGNPLYFSPGTAIPPRGFVVVVPNPDRFRQTYGDISSPVVGNYTKNLSNSGEKVTLADALGAVQRRSNIPTNGPGIPTPTVQDVLSNASIPIRPSPITATGSPAGSIRRREPRLCEQRLSIGRPPVYRLRPARTSCPRARGAVRIAAEIELDGLVSPFSVTMPIGIPGRPSV
jgi:hypothetical protein